jgi:hypothetical protein
MYAKSGALAILVADGSLISRFKEHRTKAPDVI